MNIGGVFRSRLPIASIAVLWCANAAAQPPEIRELVASECSTEGGSVEVKLDAGKITSWQGSFCSSTGCTHLQVGDLAADGTATVTVKRQYLDGGDIAYTATARRAEPEWRLEAMMALDYSVDVGKDIELVGKLFKQTEIALTNGDGALSCDRN